MVKVFAEGITHVPRLRTYGTRSHADVICSSGGTAFAVRIEQADPDDIARAPSEARAVVANAVSWPEAEQDRSGLGRDLSANVAGTITLAENALPGTRATGWGRAIDISSGVVDHPAPTGSRHFFSVHGSYALSPGSTQTATSGRAICRSSDALPVAFETR